MSVAFDNILNFRDIGKTINDHLGRKIVREGVFYRSARPDEASSADRKKLKDELGIRTVVDLRTKTEHLKQAQKHQAILTNASALSRSNATLAEPIQIPGLRYREIKVTGRRFEMFLLRQLTWWSFFKVLFLFVLGYRTQAISIIGKEVMQPQGLIGLGIVTLSESGAEIAEALRTLTLPSSLPLLVHCTQGKDRTGLVVALTLMVLGVPNAAITHDYVLSREGLAADQEQRMEEIKELGLTPEWGDVPDDFVERVGEYLDGRYGGVGGYLDSVGFGKEERGRLVEMLGA
ncbi:protein-tyrosine phosphatase-like protein [Daldinia sp. FL1419]|nr:protein-tyrosine phosphatase-like protein [Daldinia sp. FL1419]